jgi:hypothetical protein
MNRIAWLFVSLACASLACSAAPSGGSVGTDNGSAARLESAEPYGIGGTAGCLFDPAELACTGCLESQCGDAVNAAVDGCSDYQACACPHGTFDARQAGQLSCLHKSAERSCEVAASSLVKCTKDKCDLACYTMLQRNSGFLLNVRAHAQ